MRNKKLIALVIVAVLVFFISIMEIHYQGQFLLNLPERIRTIFSWEDSDGDEMDEQEAVDSPNAGAGDHQNTAGDSHRANGDEAMETPIGEITEEDQWVQNPEDVISDSDGGDGNPDTTGTGELLGENELPYDHLGE